MKWTKKKIIVPILALLFLCSAGLGVWAAYPSLWSYFRPQEVTPTISAEPEQKELTSYQNIVLSVASSEKDLSISFLDSAEAAIAGQTFSVKVVCLGSKEEINQEELDKTTADNLFTMPAYAASVEDQVQADTTDASKKSVTVDTYTAGISAYQQQLDALEGTVYTDEDGDGSIYQKNLDPGIYQIWYVPTDGYFPDIPVVNVEVKNKVERVVDTKIEEKVTPYVASEDVQPARQVAVEKTITDTTAKVETKTETETNTESTDVLYTGWQTIDGKTYYFDANHQKVTGQQTINGLMYRFNEDGSLVNSLGAGVDVSKWNGTINWSKVKAAGINYAFVRCGGRSSSARTLFEDPNYGQNVSGAIAAGLKVGIYFYSSATTTAEAVEEASLAVAMAKKYKITLPIFIDIEDSAMPKGQLTEIAQAFCQTVQSAGYTAGVYSSISWWKSYLDYSKLSSYKIWIARFNTVLSGGNYTWTGRCDYWQYSGSGTIDGINGNVDLNIAY